MSRVIPVITDIIQGMFTLLHTGSVFLFTPVTFKVTLVLDIKYP